MEHLKNEEEARVFALAKGNASAQTVTQEPDLFADAKEAPKKTPLLKRLWLKSRPYVIGFLMKSWVKLIDVAILYAILKLFSFKF